MNKILLLTSVILLLLGFSVGYGMGFIGGVKLAVSYGMEFIDIDINEQMVQTALFQYRNNIGGCLFTQNASLYINEGNKE